MRAVPERGGQWKKLVSNLEHFIEDVLEGWANEGRTFASDAEKQAAIGALVTGTIRRIKEDPKGWMKNHCDR